MESGKHSILTIAYYFDPNTAVGALRSRRFHRYLSEFGYSSQVIAAVVDPADQLPNVHHIPDRMGEFWEERAKAVASGAEVEPLSLTAHCERAIRKFFLPHSGLTWSRTAATFARTLIEPNVGNTTVVSSYPALGTHLTGLQLVSNPRVRWVADFRDPFARYFPKMVVRTQDWLERKIMRQADAVIANTEAVAVQWRKQYPWARHKIHVIWNGFDPEEEIEALPVTPSPWKRVIHTGSLYAGRNANTVIASLSRLRSRSTKAAQVQIVLVGGVSTDSGVDDRLYDQAAAEGWLEFQRTAVPKEKANRLTQEAEGLLLLQPQNAVLVPGKLFEYALIGRPILSLAPAGSSIEWILQNSGLPHVCLHPEDSEEVTDHKLASFLDLPTTPVTANQWFRENFDGRKQTRQLAAIIDSVQDRPS